MPDLVDHPAHYKSPSGLESIDVIEAFGLGFHLGNAVKYILRCEKKGAAIQDLQKARWYLDREISRRSPDPKPSTPLEILEAMKHEAERDGYSNSWKDALEAVEKRLGAKA